MVVLVYRQAVYLTIYIGLGLTVLLFLLIRDKPSWIVQVPRSYFSWKHTWGRVLELLKNWRFWIASFVGCFLFLPISTFASLWDVNFMIQALPSSYLRLRAPLRLLYCLSAALWVFPLPASFQTASKIVAYLFS